MAQAKKKQSTKTSKKTTAKPCSCKKSCAKNTKQAQTSQSKKLHVYFIMTCSVLAAGLLLANTIMLM